MLFRNYTKELFATLLLLALFLLASYFSQSYSVVLTGLLGDYGTVGMLVYVVGATLATVIAPLSFLPALPIAVTLWGSFIAALLSIIAWTLGAAIAYIIARRFGRPLVEHLVGKSRLEYFSRFLPTRYLFLAVVFLRMALPVDLLSYVLGLFNIMRFWPYVGATIIGITPFAFVFAYLADVPILFQFGALIAGAFIVVFSFPHMKRHYKQIFLQEEKKDSYNSKSA